MSGPSTTRPMLWRDLATCLGLLVPLLMWDLTSWDLVIMRAIASPSGFAWRDHWLTTVVLHEGGRLAGWIVLGGLVWQLRRPLPFAHDLPAADRRWWLATSLLCLAAIALLKHASLTSCPWSLAEFGGVARHVSHWRLGVADGGSGGCFPSGHASAAFSFLSGYFALRERYPTAARCWLVGVIALGVVFGFGQTLRGAHYPSHTLWTAWFCLALTLASHHGWRAWRHL
jgi:membrane-associated PAP2 superfamily phosphatase